MKQVINECHGENGDITKIERDHRKFNTKCVFKFIKENRNVERTFIQINIVTRAKRKHEKIYRI